MNIKGLFSGVSNLGFNLKKSTLMNKHTPSENRCAAMEYFKSKTDALLKKNRKDEAVEVATILLGRLSFTVSNSIKDSDEKEFVKEYIKGLGTVSVGPLKKYIVENDSIAHAIDVLRSIEGNDRTLDFLDSIITADDTLFDDKLVEKRVEILKQFAGETFPSMLSKSLAFLRDSDDRLVIASIRFLRDYVFEGEEDSRVPEAMEAMIDLFADPDASNRIRIELLHAFIEQNWRMSGFKKKLENGLPDGYYINSQGYIRVIEDAAKSE
ncbi:MAG: hypothetical protein JXA66_06550 [Oligoflexia bacterium]|nr:hypothetical protein [Oligoflexia bacterium]